MEIITLKDVDDSSDAIITENKESINQKENIKDTAVIGVYDVNLKVSDGFRFGVGVILSGVLFSIIFFVLGFLFTGTFMNFLLKNIK